MLKSNLDVSEMFVERENQRSSMHSQHLNEQLVRVLKTIGYDVGFQKGQGQYLYDRDGARYLDLLSGFGVFAIGRNHPVMREALKSVLDADQPNLVQFDVSVLAGVLAERLLKYVPYLDKAFFANSGAECVEAAIKFARGATGRPGIVYCAHGYHGLTYGALSLTGDSNFRTGFEPLLPGCTPIPFNDLAALEKALSSREVAAFVVEPIQGKGVNMPTDEFLPGAAALCKKYGTLFVADEIQRGMGLMIGIEVGPPKSLRLKASWNVLETANKGLFCQLITVPLFKDHKILTQVAGHGSHTIKLLPPLVLTEEDCNWIAASFDTVIADSHKVPGAIWSLG